MVNMGRGDGKMPKGDNVADRDQTEERLLSCVVAEISLFFS